MRVLGVTGLIGAGKSTLCRRLQSLGIYWYDCDSRAKVLMQKHGIVITDEFFMDPDIYQTITKMVWDLVQKDIQKVLMNRTETGFLIESAVLYQSTLSDFCDAVLVVLTDDKTRHERLSLPRNKIKQRESHQVYCYPENAWRYTPNKANEAAIYEWFTTGVSPSFV